MILVASSMTDPIPFDDAAAMRRALALAEQAQACGEIPVGALLVKNGAVVAEAYNTREADGNPLHHAEIRVLSEAAKIWGDWRLSDCDLFVTLEPCPMCLGALFQARVRRLVFAAFDTKRLAAPDFASLQHRLTQPEGAGAMTVNNHTLQIRGGLLAKESAALLKDFFARRRQASAGKSADKP